MQYGDHCPMQISSMRAGPSVVRPQRTAQMHDVGVYSTISKSADMHSV